MACSIFLLYLDDVTHAFEKISQLVIKDWYFNGRMETISTKKGNERKGHRNIAQKRCMPCFVVGDLFNNEKIFT